MNKTFQENVSTQVQLKVATELVDMHALRLDEGMQWKGK